MKKIEEQCKTQEVRSSAGKARPDFASNERLWPAPWEGPAFPWWQQSGSHSRNHLGRSLWKKERGAGRSCELPAVDCAVACKAHLAKAGFYFLAVICYIVKYGEKIDLNRIVLNLPLPKNGQKCNCQRQVSILSNP